MTEWPQLDDIHRAIRAHDGAASAPDIAHHLGKAETGIRNVIRAAVPRRGGSRSWSASPANCAPGRA